VTNIVGGDSGNGDNNNKSGGGGGGGGGRVVGKLSRFMPFGGKRNKDKDKDKEKEESLLGADDSFSSTTEAVRLLHRYHPLLLYHLPVP
jgi:hypothetical protein